MKKKIYNNLKKNKGVTILALTITIAVLILLVTVSIRIAINTGVINKTEEGVGKYINLQIRDKLITAYNELKASKNLNINIEDEDFLKQRIEAQDLIVKFITTTNDGWEINIDDTMYILSDYGDLDIGNCWVSNNNGTYSSDGKTIKIGDYVNYDPTLNAAEGTTTYTSYSATNASSEKNRGRTSGYDNDQSFDAATYKNAGFGWRVLDVKNGKIRLIADTDVGPGDYSESATQYYLKGSAGYINGVAELNAICSIFGHGKGAQSATSITVDDIKEVTKYNPENPRYNQGEWGEYGSKVTFTRGSGNALSAVLTNGKTWSGNDVFTNYFADGSKTLSTLAENSSTPQITSTVYFKSYNNDVSKEGVLNLDGTFSTPYELLFGKYKYDASNNYDRSFKGTRESIYWLASENVNVYANGIQWGLRTVWRC